MITINFDLFELLIVKSWCLYAYLRALTFTLRESVASNKRDINDDRPAWVSRQVNYKYIECDVKITG